MTEITANPTSASPARRRTYLLSVGLKTIAPIGAKIGLVWLSLIACLAIFAPFLANSDPYLIVTTEGDWLFPLFRHLSPVDVALPLLAVVAVGLFFFSWQMRWKMLSFLAALVVVGGLCWLTITPPQNKVVFTTESGLPINYRQMVKADLVDWAIPAPISYSPTDRQRDRVDRTYLPPGTDGHLLGTEKNGSDVLSRMIHACRIAIAVGFIATGLALLIGITVGALMGFFSGIVDLIGMRFVEIFAAIPTLFLLLTLVAVIPPEWRGYMLYIMMAIIGLTGWVGYARFLRAEFLKIRAMDYVQAARACGIPLPSILFRHMLPNGVAPVLVEASFGVASAILYESVLSFIGLGLVDEPSWGQMLGEATGSTGDFKWWMAIFPGFAIFLTVFAFVLIGESLRDAIDPRVVSEDHKNPIN